MPCVTLYLSLEERERRAFVEGHPERDVLALLLDAEALADGERQEAEKESERLSGELYDAKQRIEELEAENDKLADQIHDAGVDLV